MFKRHRHEFYVLSGVFYALMIHSQPRLAPNDKEACLLAESLKGAKAAVVSITTFTFQENEIWSRVGSGCVCRNDGLIITRQSVIQGGDSIEVTFTNGRKETAWALDCDPSTQIALLKTKYQFEPNLQFKAARTLKPKDCVVLLGNSLGVFPSITLGHVIGFQENGYFLFNGSAIAGNTGGPVFNRYGQLVGILAGRKQGEREGEHVGVAVPYECIEDVLQRFFVFANKNIGWLGFYVTDFPSGNIQGVRVISVIPDSPSDRAGISQGDTLIQLNGEKIQNASDLTRKLGELEPKDHILFDVLNNNLIKQHPVEAGQIPMNK